MASRSASHAFDTEVLCLNSRPPTHQPRLMRSATSAFFGLAY